MAELLLTPAEAAELTGISVNTIRQMCDEDPEFPSFKVGTYNKIGRAALEEWVNKKCQLKSNI
jgi:excisionase family DNA binding protein